MTQTILVVDDTFNVQQLLSEYLGSQGFTVVTASNGHNAMLQLKQHQPDLVLLDIMMPHMDGYEFIQKLRETSELPVIMITAKQQESDVVKGFELGADDYIIKPFKMSELLVRIKAVLKRTSHFYSQSHLLKFGELVLNTANKELRINDHPVELTPAEFALLQMLVGSAEHTVNKANLCSHLINEGYSGSESTLKIHIRNLRSKLETVTKQWLQIESVFGIGYRLRKLEQ